MKKLLLAISASSLLVGCASLFGGDDEDTNPYANMTEKQLYQSAQTELKKKQYTTASKQLEAMETMYPFSDKAESAQLALIDAYYKNEDFIQAAATADRFIRLYPRSNKIDKAYYMKAMANFNQTRGVWAKIFTMDETWRDPGTQTEAYTDFQQLIALYPQSQYRKKAEEKTAFLRNAFAKHDLNMAEYYLDKKMYIAAKARADEVIKQYPDTACAKDALKIIYKTSSALGLTQNAAQAMNEYSTKYHDKLDAIETKPTLMSGLLNKVGFKKQDKTVKS